MEPVWNILAWVVLPLWVLAGFLDYLCHRRSDIEHATGTLETMIHWLMLAEIGVPLLLVVLFRINALVIAAMLVCLVAHEITGYFDLRLAMATRRVTVFEHQVHSLLEVLPLAAALLLMILHWPQAMALFGAGREPAEWFIGRKQMPRLAECILPGAAFFLFAVLPYAEELYRGLRAKDRLR